MKTNFLTLLLMLTIYNSNAQNDTSKDSISEKIPFEGM